MKFVLTLFLVLQTLAALSSAEVDAPLVRNGSEEASLIAIEPLVRQPVGLCVDHFDRLLVIESHTHFRPEDYEGPEGDRVLWLQDLDGDSVADEAVVLLEGLQNACLIKPHPNGWIYITTRSEVLRIRDEDGDGSLEAIERKLAWLETEGNHPHNGISGLAFDQEGNLYVGMGENLGADYTIHGSDGSKVSDGGEGGNVWFMGAQGERVSRFATGFWNPFGMAMDNKGTLFASDNDPSSTPPSRLHRVIQGGDYGFQYRYGRSGKHPFVSWNGELPGTIPMLAGVGEAPCDILLREGPDYTDVLVTSWVDHWIEIHRFYREPGKPSQRGILLQGGPDFRPVSMDWSADGKSLYVTNWVKRSYKLHGYGRVWKFPFVEPEWEETFDPSIASIQNVDLVHLAESDPWAQSQFIEKLSQSPARLRAIDWTNHPDPITRSLIFLAWGRSDLDERLEMLAKGLGDSAGVVRLLALKWIADEQLSQFQSEVDQVLEKESHPDLFYAALTTRARLEGSDIDDKHLAHMLRLRVLDEQLPAETRLAALRVFPNPEDSWKAADLAPLLQHEDLPLRSHALRLMTQLTDQEKRAFLERFVEDSDQPKDLSRFALAGLPERPLPDSDSTRRPDRPSLDSFPHPWLEWLLALPGKADAEHGRFVFYHPALGGCAICHQIDGIGRTGGPDLSRIGEMSDEHIITSLLNPSIEVAPQYQPWLIETTDGRTLTVFQLGEVGGTHTYADIAGNTIQLNIEQIANRKQIDGSLMPPGLFAKLNDSQARDLIAFLASLAD